MSTLNSTQFNAIPFNAPGMAATIPVPLALDTRSLVPNIYDVRSIVVAKLNQRITALVAGDTWKFLRTYTGLTTGVTISKVYLTIKNDPTDADVSALIQRSITTSATAAGQITDASTSDGTIAFNVIVLDTQSDDLTPLEDYYYDFQGIGSDGAVYTFETGIITPAQGVTTASS